MIQIINNGPFQLLSNIAIKNQTQTKGSHWSKQQIIKYAVFLNYSQKNKQDSYSLEQDSWSYFRKLSIFVQSKNPNQCRIFHKRMMNDHESLETLIMQLKQKVDKFEEWEVSLEQNIQNIKLCLKREKKQAQKQLSTQKICLNKINQTNDHQTFDLDKKEINLDPTATEYIKDQTKNNRLIRPNFSIDSEIKSYEQSNKSKIYMDERSKTIIESHNTLLSYLNLLNKVF